MKNFNFFGIPILSIFGIEFLQNISQETITFLFQVLIFVLVIIKMIITKDIKLKDNVVSLLTLIINFLKFKNRDS